MTKHTTLCRVYRDARIPPTERNGRLVAAARFLAGNEYRLADWQIEALDKLGALSSEGLPRKRVEA